MPLNPDDSDTGSEYEEDTNKGPRKRGKGMRNNVGHCVKNYADTKLHLSLKVLTICCVPKNLSFELKMVALSP